MARARPDHDVELLAVAPDLAAVISCDRETLTSSASPEERTRFYPQALRRVAHGLVDLINDYVTRLGVERTLVVTPCRRGGPDRCRVARHPHPWRPPVAVA